MYVQCLAPYKQEVGGSSPSLPTKHCAARNAFRSLSSVVNCYSQRLTGSRRILPRRAADCVYTGLSKLSELIFARLPIHTNKGLGIQSRSGD